MHGVCSTERDISIKMSIPPVYRSSGKTKRLSCYLPNSPTKPRGTMRSQTNVKNLIHTATKSRFLQNNSSYISSEFQSKELLSYDLGLPTSAKSHKHLLSPKDPNAKKVLVIDDNSFNLLVVRHLVEGLGYRVETALNGKLGLILIKSLICSNKKPFDLILMDLQMPVMDGYETARILREMMGNKEMAEIPIIALSANDSEDDKARCREVGMYNHLSKPLKERQLRRTLEQILLDEDVSIGSLCDASD